MEVRLCFVVQQPAVGEQQGRKQVAGSQQDIRLLDEIEIDDDNKCTYVYSCIKISVYMLCYPVLYNDK